MPVWSDFNSRAQGRQRAARYRNKYSLTECKNLLMTFLGTKTTLIWKLERPTRKSVCYPSPIPFLPTNHQEDRPSKDIQAKFKVRKQCPLLCRAFRNVASQEPCTTPSSPVRHFCWYLSIADRTFDSKEAAAEKATKDEEKRYVRTCLWHVWINSARLGFVKLTEHFSDG
jgi:hypothetical protein